MMKISKNLVLFSCVLLLANTVLAKASLGIPLIGKTTVSFIENKGQVTDQFHQPRTDVLFAATDGAISYFLKPNGFNYQQSRVDLWTYDSLPGLGKTYRQAAQTTFYRIDVEWKGANPEAFVTGERPLDGYSNFYTPANPNGITQVRSYQDVYYTNLYSGVDLHVYSISGTFKYDFRIAANAD